MIINEKILHLPPYLSATWKHIVSLQVEGHSDNWLLIVELITGSRIAIPGLDRKILEAIFAAHALYAERKNSPASISQETSLFGGARGFAGIEGMAGMMQHSQELANSSDLNPDFLAKISEISQHLGLAKNPDMIKAEPHCNCPHCQIARALEGKSESAEEIVSDADLKFRSWDVKQESENLFIVSNPLDSKEAYSVFLGETVGCTCGKKSCEHIEAALQS